mmetsp:Transcript_49959/g.109151  ORF Transcript_49959/g.109151 Transcript_49959/m.109151 type:complete len:373 (+) Transcript_49959:458-1576(+)
MESVQVRVQEFFHIGDALGVFPQDPNHGSLGLRLIQFIDMLADLSQDGLKLGRILSEDILNDNDRGLDHMSLTILQQFRELLNASLGCPLEFDSTSPDSSNGLANKVNINFHGIILEFFQDLVHIPFRGQVDHDVHLLHLDVNGIRIFAEEHLNISSQNGRPLLHDQQDVTKRNVLDFFFARQQSDQWRIQLFAKCPKLLFVPDPIHELENHFDRSQHNSRIRMSQSGLDTLNCVARIFFISRIQLGQGVQNENLSPFRALQQGREQLLSDTTRAVIVQVQQGSPGCFLNLGQCSNGIRHHDRVAITKQITRQYINEALVLHELRINFVDLCNANPSSLPHVGIGVAAGRTKPLQQILSDFIQPNASHGSHR